MATIDYDFEDTRLRENHIEYVIDKSMEYHFTEEELSKKKALNSLKELEGWCTEFKASILFDLVLMMQPSNIVEIGVWGGSSLIPMAIALKHNQEGMIYGVDPWDSKESIVGMDGVNEEWWSNANHNFVYNGLIDKIQEFGLVDHVHLIKATSEAAPLIHNIDILHIDGNHSEITSYIDVTKWVPQVRKGGIIIFDDINWVTTAKAVEWLNEHCVKLIEYKDQCTWGMWAKID